ncbi:YqhR family membrane protein [Mangrovibacillus cuniculi]|nr:YqhR family membrane protein [Mangrovibacillus cuniculi]
MSDKKKLDQNQQEKPMSLQAMSLLTGLIGGLVWSGIGYIFYYFNLTKLSPKIILEPIAVGAWKDGWLGVVIALTLYGILGMGLGFFYYAALKRFRSIYVAVGFGVALYAVVFVVLHPLFPSMPSILKLDLNTMLTSLCLYILFGTFVGFSISYEQSEIEDHKSPSKADLQES